MPNKKPTTPAPRKRPAINFTIDDRLRKAAEEEAEKFGLFTAQGGEQRPRISAIFGGMVLMLKRKQLDEGVLYAAACEASGLEPEVQIMNRLSNQLVNQ